MQQVTTDKNIPTITWQDEYRNSLKSIDEINHFFNLKLDNNIPYQNFIPLSFAKRIKQSEILAKQFLPNPEEKEEIGRVDPIGDKLMAKNHGIIHRYKNRILFTPTTKCPVICRYCFRKNELSSKDNIFNFKLSELEKYLVAHPEVNEVILTGGDPLVLSDSKLEKIFNLLEKLNIKFVRIHTRTPIVIPARITKQFTNLLQNFSDKFTKIIFCLHVNHSDEIDKHVEQALNNLRDCKIDKKTQTVLLKNINDNHRELVQLFYKLLDLDFTPYYLHHPDKVKGAMHFYLGLEEGRKIYNQMRNELPGWAMPHYVIDNFQGRGKQLAFNPEQFKYSGKMLDKNSFVTEY